MLKPLLRPAYRAAHQLLFRTRDWNPWFARQYGVSAPPAGHISAEHLADPAHDMELVRNLRKAGVKVQPYRIDSEAYRAYMAKANYPRDYYGGGREAKQNFTEKTLEHFVSTEFIRWHPEAVLVDIAACNSPFFQIAKRLFPLKRSYQQDLIFPPGLSGHQIGGYAHELAVPDASIDAVTLHCSLEHFEGDSDTLFFQSLERVLKPGGRAIVLPFYLAHTYTIHVDPAFNLLKGHRPQLDSAASIRYCDWHQYFSRHYDPAALTRRILQAAPTLELNLYQVQNYRVLEPEGYLRFVGVFEKKPKGPLSSHKDSDNQ